MNIYSRSLLSEYKPKHNSFFSETNNKHTTTIITINNQFADLRQQFNNLKDKLSRKETENKVARANIERLDNQLRDAKAEIEEKTDEIEYRISGSKEYNNEYKILNEKFNTQRKLVETKQNKINSLEKTIIEKTVDISQI